MNKCPPDPPGWTTQKCILQTFSEVPSRTELQLHGNILIIFSWIFLFSLPFLSLFNFFLKNWSIVNLQCCANLCCTAKWFSYTHIDIFKKYSFPLWLISGYWISFLMLYSGAFQVALVVKNPPANAGDMRDVDLIPQSGRSSGGGRGNSLQYSCLGNSMDRGAWWFKVHRVVKSHTQLKRLSMHTCYIVGSCCLSILYTIVYIS